MLIKYIHRETETIQDTRHPDVSMWPQIYISIRRCMYFVYLYRESSLFGWPITVSVVFTTFKGMQSDWIAKRMINSTLNRRNNLRRQWDCVKHETCFGLTRRILARQGGPSVFNLTNTTSRLVNKELSTVWLPELIRMCFMCEVFIVRSESCLVCDNTHAF